MRGAKGLAASVCAIALVGAMAASAVPCRANAAAGDVYTQNFSDAAEVNAHFNAYYLYQMGGSSSLVSVGESKEDGQSWYVQDGVLHRQAASEDEIGEDFGTSSIAILTLTERQYVNFELTVDYLMGDETLYWPVVAFRQSEAGRYFLEDGAGIFVQQQGYVTVWGADGVGGPYESLPIANYSSQSWHTMRVRVEGRDLKVFVDDMATAAYSRTLPATIFRRGYLSLISVNNDSAFKNLSVKELEVSDIDDGMISPPVPDAGTPDSLDGMAERVERIDELSGLKQDSDFARDEGGCASSVESVGLIAFAAAAAAVCILRIRKKKK